MTSKSFNVTLFGYGPYGDGPCGYDFDVSASSEEEAIGIAYERFSKEFPECAHWGIYDSEVSKVQKSS